MYLVKIRKTVCFEHNVKEFFVLYFGPLLVNQNSFDIFLSEGSTDASCKVWCKSFELPRWRLKKYVFHLLRFCEWKVTAKVGVAYTKQFS